MGQYPPVGIYHRDEDTPCWAFKTRNAFKTAFGLKEKLMITGLDSDTYWVATFMRDTWTGRTLSKRWRHASALTRLKQLQEYSMVAVRASCGTLGLTNTKCRFCDRHQTTIPIPNDGHLGSHRSLWFTLNRIVWFGLTHINYIGSDRIIWLTFNHNHILSHRYHRVTLNHIGSHQGGFSPTSPVWSRFGKRSHDQSITTKICHMTLDYVGDMYGLAHYSNRCKSPRFHSTSPQISTVSLYITTMPTVSLHITTDLHGFTLNLHRMDKPYKMHFISRFAHPSTSSLSGISRTATKHLLSTIESSGTLLDLRRRTKPAIRSFTTAHQLLSSVGILTDGAQDRGWGRV